MKKKKKFLFFRLEKARPDQAGFFLRGFAFVFDVIIIFLLSLFILICFSELVAALEGKPGLIEQFVKEARKGGSIIISGPFSTEKTREKVFKKNYLRTLKTTLSPEEYKKAEEMSFEEIEKNFQGEIQKTKGVWFAGGGNFEIIYEFFVFYFYFILFFRYGRRTPGKHILRLRAVSLKGNDRLSWYQCFERTHGYATSGLGLFIGFWQVLWDPEGMTMHDKIAGTTVIRLPKKIKKKMTKIRKNKKSMLRKKRTKDEDRS